MLPEPRHSVRKDFVGPPFSRCYAPIQLEGPTSEARFNLKEKVTKDACIPQCWLFAVCCSKTGIGCAGTREFTLPPVMWVSGLTLRHIFSIFAAPRQFLEPAKNSFAPQHGFSVLPWFLSRSVLPLLTVSPKGHLWLFMGYVEAHRGNSHRQSGKLEVPPRRVLELQESAPFFDMQSAKTPKVLPSSHTMD